MSYYCITNRDTLLLKVGAKHSSGSRVCSDMTFLRNEQKLYSHAYCGRKWNWSVDSRYDGSTNATATKFATAVTACRVLGDYNVQVPDADSPNIGRKATLRLSHQGAPQIISGCDTFWSTTSNAGKGFLTRFVARCEPIYYTA